MPLTPRIYVDLLPADDGLVRVVVTNEEGEVMVDQRVEDRDMMPVGLRALLNFPGFRVSGLTLERVDGVRD